MPGIGKQSFASRKGKNPAQLRSLFLELVGSPETIRRQIAAYEAAGMQEMRLLFPDAVNLEAIRL